MSLTLDRAKEVLAACRGRRVLVIGDLMLDRYVHGRVDRISPEAPVPVVLVTREHSVPGGACNVAANIAALGGQAHLAGIDICNESVGFYSKCYRRVEPCLITL